MRVEVAKLAGVQIAESCKVGRDCDEEKGFESLRSWPAVFPPQQTTEQCGCGEDGHRAKKGILERGGCEIETIGVKPHLAVSLHEVGRGPKDKIFLCNKSRP